MIDHIILDTVGGDCELTAAAIAQVQTEASFFLRAGGAVTWDLWRGMCADTKAAFVAAGDALRAQSAVAAGIASFGPIGSAQILSPHDGGDMLVDTVIDSALEGYMARRRADNG